MKEISVDEFHNNGCRDLTGDSEEGVFTHWVIKVGGSDRGTGSPLSPLPLRPGKRSLSPEGVDNGGVIEEVKYRKSARTRDNAVSTSMGASYELPSGYVLDEGVLATIAGQYECSEDEALHLLVEKVRDRSRPCISGFRVGAAAKGADGNIYLGVNIEFKGLPTFVCIHAEQFAVINAICHRSWELDAIAVSAPPCGHCRQFLAELASKQMDVSVTGENGQLNLPTLLPYSFDGSAIDENNAQQNAGGPIPETRKASLTLLTATKNNLELIEAIDDLSADLQDLVQLALKEANRSHAPYSKSPAGVALRGSAGCSASGPYIENAAFNPAVSALQSSLVHYVVQGGKDWEDIRDVVLVQVEGCSIGHEWSTRMLLEKIAGQARFHTVKCKRVRT